jgi:hypothetical protein
MWKIETKRKETMNRRKARWKGNDGYNIILYSGHVPGSVLFLAVLK